MNRCCGITRVFQDHYPGNFQIVVVLNGCRDNTLDVVQRVAPISRQSVARIPGADWQRRRAYRGLKLAPLADVVGYVDADGATRRAPFTTWSSGSVEADCVIGSRWLTGAVLHQPQTGKRQFASRVFHLSSSACSG